MNLGSCLPVRSFPPYKGQQNYPGWFWIIAFPEAVALTAILADLDLRRHIALELGRSAALPADRRVHRRAVQPVLAQLQRPGPQVGPRPPRQVRATPLRGLARPLPPPERFK